MSEIREELDERQRPGDTIVEDEIETAEDEYNHEYELEDDEDYEEDEDEIQDASVRQAWGDF